MSIKSKIAAAAAVLAITGAATAPAALASAPTPFPVYDNGSALVIAHPVKSGDRLVVAGRPFTVGTVTHDGPAFEARVKGNGLPPAWKNKTLPAVAESR